MSSSASKQAAEFVDKKAASQQEQDAHRAAVQQSPDPSQIRRELIDKLSETDLQEPTVGILKNLITADWVLANLDADDYREFKNRLESTKLRVLDMHPAPESEVVGKDRAYINARNDTLKPLSPQQKETINEFFEGIRLRLTRSKNMEQQRLLQTRIVESSVNRGDSNNNSDGLVNRILNR